MRKKKKVVIIVCCATAVIIAVIIGIYMYYRPVKAISFSQDKITRAYITNGNNGNITELAGDNLALIYKDMKDVELNRVKNVETGGWSYRISFCIGEETKSITMISATVWTVSNNRYEAAQKDGDRILKDISTIEK